MSKLAERKLLLAGEAALTSSELAPAWAPSTDPSANCEKPGIQHT